MQNEITILSKQRRRRLDQIVRLSMAVLFVLAVMVFMFTKIGDVSNGYFLLVAGMVGAYMAINIGANDVANNVGATVGSGAITLGGALILAGLFEAAGALLAGGDVVGTIKKGIIDPALIEDADTFIWLMMAALLAAALWLNLATAFGAPVSTTHSIVGGVSGAGMAAGGLEIANWNTMGQIAASWIISPVMGGLIAALFLYVIKRQITYKKDMVAATRKVVPFLVAIMATAFSAYLVKKGLGKIWKVNLPLALAIGIGIGVGVYVVVKPIIARVSESLTNDKVGVNSVFTVPLICSAALLCFAHGANDVANAVGPLAAINDSILHGNVVSKATIPLWVMLVGALGIVVGLLLYGPRLIKTVGSEITELDKMRAFCIAMAAAITVLIASQFGLPVSSTHIAVGGVFGVGFLREYLKVSYARVIHEIEEHHVGVDQKEIDVYLHKFEDASIVDKGRMLKELKKSRKSDIAITKRERKDLKKVYKQELVRRSLLFKIIAAWIITVPIAATIAAMLYFMLRGMLLV